MEPRVRKQGVGRPGGGREQSAFVPLMLRWGGMLRRGQDAEEGRDFSLHTYTPCPRVCVGRQGSQMREGAFEAVAAAHHEHESARPPGLCSCRRSAGNAEPRRGEGGGSPGARLRVSTSPHFAAGERGEKFGSPSSLVEEVPAS